MAVTVLKNAFLIDCTGADPQEAMTVVVDGDTIAEVTAGSPGRLPDDARIVDLAGRTLMPGLIDAHVHACAVEANPAEQHRRLAPSFIAILAGIKLREMLQLGFTTVRDAGGADFGFREAVETGKIDGPRMRVSGNHLYQTGGHGDKRRPAELCGCVMPTDVGLVGGCVDGVDEMRKAVRENLRRQADQIKLMCSGGAMSAGDELDVAQFSREEIRVAVEEAAAAKRYVMAHAYSATAVTNAAVSGVRSIEHGNLIDEAAAIVVRDAGAFLVPTLVTYEALWRHGKDFGVPPFQMEKVGAARESGLKGLEIAYRAGVKIGSGSDLMGDWVRYQPMELELKAEVMPAMEVLVATTRTNAELMRLDAKIGTIEAGKLADILVVDGNPLDHIAVLQDASKLSLVMKAGKIFKSLMQ